MDSWDGWIPGFLSITLGAVIGRNEKRSPRTQRAMATWGSQEAEMQVGRTQRVTTCGLHRGPPGRLSVMDGIIVML